MPLVVLSVVLHRLGLISSNVFQIAALVAGLVAALAVLLAGIALLRLWFTGDHGWRNCFWAVFWGLLCLVPFAWHAQLAWRYPHVTDVATASTSLLPLTFEPDTAVMPNARMLSREDHLHSFPSALTRAYPIAREELHALVLRLIAQQGWDVRFDQVPSEFSGRINARVTTLIGWREEVVFGISATSTGSKIDMRSASIGAAHDFGSNGNRIMSFLSSLDNEVTAFIRDNPSLNQPDAADEAESPQVEMGGA